MGTEVARARHRAEVGSIVRRVVRGFFRTASPDAAAGLTFYALLAMVPTVVAAFSLIALLGDRKDGVRAVLDVAKDVLPPDVVGAIGEPIEQLASAANIGWYLVVALVIAVWSVARYVTALGRAINRIYDVPEGRVLWKAKPVHLLVTLVVFLLVSLAGGLAVASWPLVQAVGRATGASEVTLLVWRIARWPVLVAVVVIVVALLYYFAPNIAHPRFRLISLGAVIAIALFALASVGFGFYVSNLADYDRIYGSFAGIVMLLLWLWIGNMSLLAGALFDAEMERIRELRHGIPAERDIQVPLRDTERVRRNARAELEEARAARRFRRSRR
ncbi:YihY/virulence factor BrkB family protein [Microbacterium sp. NPDC058345]|uniref:YihY/virulence factor BrkB family protein n=1 Tax=Microbacterium sp. NPDC058345 TaxID=3346455 RepID=UPI00365FC8EE